MKMYGFELISDENAKKLGLPSGSGLFKNLFEKMEKEVKINRKLKDDVRSAIHLGDEKNKEQREVSFLNRYFIFKKITEDRSGIILGQTQKQTQTITTQSKPKPVIKKLVRRTRKKWSNK